MAKHPLELELKKFKQEIKDYNAESSSFPIKTTNLSFINNEIIHTKGMLEIYEQFLDLNGELKIPISRANAIEIHATNLSSFKNFPEIILNNSPKDMFAFNSLSVAGQKITSIEGIPKIFKGNVTLSANKFSDLSFEKVHKFIKEIDGYINLHPLYKGPLLGFLLINNLKFLNNYIRPIPGYENLMQVSIIIDKHLKGNKDVLECQEELIEKGFKQFAKL